MAAGNGPDGADGAGLVLAVHKEQVGGRRGNVQPVVVDPHQVRFPAHRGAGDGHIVAGRAQRGGNQAGVFVAVGGGFLSDLQAPLPGQHRGVDHIDGFPADRAQQPHQQGRLEDVRVVGGDFALAAQGKSHELAPGQAGQQAPHH